MGNKRNFMAQIIIIEPNQSLQELISLNLKTYLSSEIIPRDNAKEAIALLNILPSIDLIITTYQVGSENTAKNLHSYLKQNPSETQMVILGGPNSPKHIQDMPQELSSYFYVPSTKDWEKVITHCGNLLGHSTDVMNKKSHPDFVSIPIDYFLHLNTTCCDTFLRIKKGPNKFQFIKRIHAGDNYNKEMIYKYKDQGLKNFFIPKQDQQNFTNYVSDFLVNKLSESSPFPSDGGKINAEDIPNQYFEQLDVNFHVALNEIKTLGFTSATIQLTDSIIENMMVSINQSSKMSTLLRKVLNSKSRYLYQHAHLTLIVATEILVALGKNTPHNIELLSYACFFKDIALGDRPELAKISTVEQLKESNLSSDDWGLIMNHAKDGADIIRHHDEAPLSIDQLILTHHGSPDGRGFFDKADNNLKEFNLIQNLFILCNDFVVELLLFKEKGGKPQPIIQILKDRYGNEKTSEILALMEKILKTRSSKN